MSFDSAAVLAAARPGMPTAWLAGALTYHDHGSREGSAVALTFDDGPGRLTARVLDVLAAAGARATFNVLGERIEGREATLRRVLDEGHELGNHAFRHESLAGRPLAAVRQLRATNAAVVRATGVRPRLFRAPYGWVSPGTVRAARLAGLTTVGWDVDPHDYEAPPATEIRARVEGAARAGSIVLLHDDRRALEGTAVALEGILETLARRGLRCVTAGELLGVTPGRPGAAPPPTPS